MNPPSSSSRPAPGRRRVSRRRYWGRRLGVLAVVGVVGYAGVVAASGMFDGDDTANDDAADDVATELDTVDEVDDGDAGEATIDEASGLVTAEGAAPADPASGDPAADSDSTAAADTDDDVDDTDSDAATDDDAADADGGADDEPPSPSNPASVYIVGDSDAGTFGPYLQELLDGTLVAETDLNYKVSSGLARPDFFNWPAELEATLPEVDPDIVVVTFGGNDSQGLSTPEKPTNFIIGDPVANEAEWSEEYQRRAGEVMDILLENDRKVIWVGIPNDDNDDVTARLAIQDRAAKAAAAERPDVVFVDTWARFSGRDGGWAEFVVDPRDGIGKDVRADDGFHLNVTGAEILAIDIAVEVRDALRDMGANI